MANLTIVVDEEVLLRARKRALDQSTSVNAVLRDYLEFYAGRPGRASAMKRLIDRAMAAGARSRKAWSRDELHER